jgi:hypothetical protein
MLNMHLILCPKSNTLLHIQKRAKRNFSPGSQKWPKNVVPYIFDENLGKSYALFSRGSSDELWLEKK